MNRGGSGTEPVSGDVSSLLRAWSDGDQLALALLIPIVHDELRRLAHHYMRRERAGHSLQTTALVNEAYLRLVDNTKPIWQGRSHFIAVAAQLMRRIMVDHAREHHSLPVLPTGATSRRQIARPRFQARRHPSEVSLSEDQNRYPRLFFDS